MKRVMLVAGLLSALMIGVVPSVHAQGNPQGAENFTLTGVIFSEGGGGLAWLQEPTLTNNQVIGVRRGDSVGPYRLTAIFEDRVELEGPAGKIFVPLYGASSSQAAAPAPAPASAGFGGLTQQLQTVADAQKRAQDAAAARAAQPRLPSTSVPSIYANNPDVHYFPLGDPRRQEGLGALLNGLGRQQE